MSDNKVTCNFCQKIINRHSLKRHQKVTKSCLEIQKKIKHHHCCCSATFDLEKELIDHQINCVQSLKEIIDQKNKEIDEKTTTLFEKK